MLTVIAEVLRDKISTLSWIERTGALTMVASRPTFATAADMQSVITGYESYPVSCHVNLQDCWEDGAYKLLEPDGYKSGVAFFMDNGGVEQIAIEGPRAANIRYKFNLKLLVWLNINRLGTDITADGCNISGRVAVFFMEKMLGRHSAAGLFGGGVEEDAFKWIEVTKVDELPKDISLFSDFRFSKQKELFFWPYDYLGLRITGEFVVNRNCLPEFGAGWLPTGGCLTPAGDVNWFSREMAEYLAGLEEFNSNEDALAGILPNGDATTPLSVGDPYWASGQHVAGADAFMKVV